MHKDFDKTILTFEQKRKEFQKSHPLKIVDYEPKIPQITRQTKRFLKLKSLFYILKEDRKNITSRYILKKPFFYGKNFLKSVFQKSSFIRQNDAFYFGVKTDHDWQKLLLNSKGLLVLGFSYCQKPLECPSGRFNSLCKNQEDHPVCSQCLIHKYRKISSGKRIITLIIPTIHYIGEKILKIKKNYPKDEILFLITACEMTLHMFGDWGNMAQIKGIGIRLGGRICNTMKAFHLSEQGIKPGLTVLSDQADQILTNSLKTWALKDQT